MAVILGCGQVNITIRKSRFSDLDPCLNLIARSDCE
jgi:hypothetical protein